MRSFIVKSIVVSFPLSPKKGDAHIIDTGTSETPFTVLNNQIAEFDGSTWKMTVLTDGDYILVSDTKQVYQYYPTGLHTESPDPGLS